MTSSIAFPEVLSSPSSSNSPFLTSQSTNHDVFLSFRREDTRNNFTVHLYQALVRKGINTYKNDKELKKGEKISPALSNAIEESKISIVIFSENYASSTWCLDELLKILECKESKQQKVLAVYYKVEPSTVRHQKESFEKAFAEHETKFDDAKVQRWKTALNQTAGLCGFHLKINEEEYEFIQNIVQEVSTTLTNRFDLHVAEFPVGLKSRVEDINMLLCIEKNDTRMIGIFGIGGIGKTTIAKVMYNLIAKEFEGHCFLVDVRESSKQNQGRLGQLQEKILSNILGKSLEVVDDHQGIELIRNRLCRKKILLVLDDVDHLDQLKKLCGKCDWFGFGSRIIIITRDKSLLTKHGVSLNYPMKEMDQNEALQLFTHHAFKSDKPIDGFADLIEGALHYAGGLPLALKVVGSNLNGEDINSWKSKLDKYKRIPEENIQEKLKISYDGLDDFTKKIFLDIACFFKGYEREYVTKILDNCDFFASIGIKKLEDKCLITIDQYDGSQYLMMHDLIQDMGREIVRQESLGEPSKLSRLSFHENKGTDQIEGILIDLPREDRRTQLNTKVFANLKNRRIKDLGTRSPFKELPSSIAHLTGVKDLCLSGCESLKKLPLLPLKTNFMELFPLLPLETNLSRAFNFSSSLSYLTLSNSGIVRLPPCIEGLVGLRDLDLEDCMQLEEILHLPPNIEYVNARRCVLLERFSHLSTESSFGIPDLKRLSRIDLSECNKVYVDVGNDAPNPLLVQERFRKKDSSMIIYPESMIPKWFKETTSYSNSCEIDILDHNASMCGHDQIVALVLSFVVRPFRERISITIKCGQQIIRNDTWLRPSMDPHDRACLQYIAGNSIDQMLSRSYREGNNMRFTFGSDSKEAIFKSAGVHLIYRNDNLIDLNNQRSKRYQDDGENDLEPDWNPQKKRWGSSTASSSLLGNESKYMEQIVQQVSKIELDCTYLRVVEYPVGIKSRVEDINMLLCIEENDVRMIGIFGIGGIGKTTIAKEMYNRITNQFEGSCFLANVRESSKQDQGGLVKLQKTILSDILKDSSLKVSNVDRGINLITERLCRKRILLVLDDVDHLDQLKKLCGRCDWFGSGSRIIITTRDEGLLTKYGVSLKYPMKEMDHNEALQLFTQHAFKSDKHIDGFADLLEDALQYAGGLPLALKVIGSNLYGEDVCYWKSELEKYKRIPEKEIQEKLKISYDGLDDSTKKVFLDIACFFKGDKREYVTKILDSCGFSAYAGIKKLNDKCLITIDQYDGNQYLWMHDLLQDMGREIVRQESPKEPGKCSRLWFDKDVREVLEKNKGTEQIEGILIDLPWEDCMIRLGSEVFAKMESLRILKIICCREIFCGRLKYLSNELRVLDWLGCSLEFLPSSFHGKKLIVLNIRGSNITDIGTGLQSKNLTRIDLSYCRYLTNISDLSSCPNLEELVLDGCTRLVEVHDSVGFLDKLVELRLEGCSNFKKLPSSFKLRSLELLELEGCTSLENFPKIECEMEHLKRVVIESTVIQGLPSSITYLTGLQELFINGCKSLVLFPINIFQLEHLKDVTVIKCPNFVNFGQEVGHNGQSMPCTQENKISSSLAYLNLSDCGFVSLPPCIEGFVGLSYLHLRDCKQLEEIVHLPPNLEQVDVTGCVLLQCFPHVSTESSFGITELKRLKLIHLSECNKVDVNVGNQAPDPLLVQERFREKDSSRIIYPGSRIPEWFKYCKETTSYTNSIEIEIDPNESICFGYQIMALVLCFVLGTLPVGCKTETITISINGQSITHANIWPSKDQHRVLLQYIAGNSIDQMVSRSYREGNNMRFTFGSDRKKAIFKSAGVHLIYRNDNLSDRILPSSMMASMTMDPDWNPEQKRRGSSASSSIMEIQGGY